MKRRSFTFAALTALTLAGAAPMLPGMALAQDAAPTPAIRPDFVLGKADAPVELIEYASFTCPHCEVFHSTVFPQLKANYIETGKVKFVLREVYFDKFGLWAGMIAQCAGEARYYGVVDMLYDKQREWIGDGEAATVGDNLRKIGALAGLSKDQIDACLNDTALAQSMVATFQKNATADEVTGTPTLVINGEKHSNMSYEELAAF